MHLLKDIAEYIDVHCATVIRAIKKIEREYEKWYRKNWPRLLFLIIKLKLVKNL